ncbi:MAG TPA: OmpA family protein [Stellaceae bacterium]|nr:OmpA family protein [Stellaceae bacterium]
MSGILAAGGLALAACASQPPQNAALNQARATYSQASGNPETARFGAYPLAEAQENLVIAQQAWSNNESPAKVTHYANLAQTQSNIASAIAKRRMASGEIVNVAAQVALGDMLFQTGKADLNARGLSEVGKLAAFLKNNPDRNISVVGYTDSTGSNKLNAKLSDQRAAAVKAALVNQGIAADRIAASGRGPANPVASNDTAKGRQQNRRVVVDISAPGAVGVGSSTPSR